MKLLRFCVALSLTLLTFSAKAVPPTPKLARGVLPTYVGEGEIVLCKTSPHLENTYEIRMAVFLAVEARKKFTLAVPVAASIDAGLAERVMKWGGEIQRRPCPSFTVSVTYFDGRGKEGDSWVLGDETAWKLLRASLRSEWLKERLMPGAKLTGSALPRLKQELSQETFRQQNLDGDDVKAMLLSMIEQGQTNGGYILLQ